MHCMLCSEGAAPLQLKVRRLVAAASQQRLQRRRHDKICSNMHLRLLLGRTKHTCTLHNQSFLFVCARSAIVTMAAARAGVRVSRRTASAAVLVLHHLEVRLVACNVVAATQVNFLTPPVTLRSMPVAFCNRLATARDTPAGAGRGRRRRGCRHRRGGRATAACATAGCSAGAKRSARGGAGHDGKHGRRAVA